MKKFISLLLSALLAATLFTSLPLTAGAEASQKSSPAMPRALRESLLLFWFIYAVGTGFSVRRSSWDAHVRLPARGRAFAFLDC